MSESSVRGLSGAIVATGVEEKTEEGCAVERAACGAPISIIGVIVQETCIRAVLTSAKDVETEQVTNARTKIRILRYFVM